MVVSSTKQQINNRGRTTVSAQPENKWGQENKWN